ncbi:hypothetical protein [Frankia gtarii]|uniref:hypothetical protein n=1 Tax=Frankia gtarii TaxID=2950102 RepID=UPI0021BFFED1|nr:hypothetical protein [Frankia gtarii]
MEVSAGPVARALRAGVFAGVCVALSAVAHLAAHGAVPDWRLLLAGLGATALLGAACCGRVSSLPAVVVLMAISQLGLHVGFAAWPASADAPDLSRLLCAAPGANTASAAAFLRAHGLLAGSAHSAVTHGAMMHGSGLAAMSCAHTIVAALTACWLRRVDASVSGARAVIGVLVRCVRRIVTAPVTPIPQAPAFHRRHPVTAFPVWRHSVDLRHSVVRRGPPRMA